MSIVFLERFTCKDGKMAQVFIQGLSGLLFFQLEGSESISNGITPWTLTFYSSDPNLNRDKLSGLPVGVLFSIQSKQNDTVDYSTALTGMIQNVHRSESDSHFTSVEDHKEYYRYQVTVVPKLYFLSFHHDSRIYINKTVSEILDAVFKEHGLKAGTDYQLDFDSAGLAATEKFSTVVQYDESDWDFMLRLMQKVGIYNYVQHECTDKGEIKHIMQFTDKKPASLAKASELAPINKPEYRTSQISTAIRSPAGSDWIGCYNWQSVEYPSIGSVGTDGYDPKDPNKVLSAQQPFKAKFVPSQHPNFGFYNPQEPYTDTDVGARVATVVANRYLAGQCEAMLSADLPCYSVMDKFTADKLWAGSKDQPLIPGFIAGDYLVTGRTFLISSAKGIEPIEFSMTVVPLTQETPALSNKITLPPAPVLSTVLRCIIVNAEGKYDAEAIRNANFASHDSVARSPFVGFSWDQAKRSGAQPDLTPVSTQFYTLPGLAALPPIGSWAAVRFVSIFESPVFMGIQYDTNNKPFVTTEGNISGEHHLFNQPVDSSNIPNVNRITFGDGSTPDPDKQKQELSIYAPGAFKLEAAQGAGDSKAQFSVKPDGSISLGNGSGASITIDAQGNITVANKQGTFKLSSDGSIQISGTNVNVAAKEALSLSSDNSLVIKSNSSMEVATEGSQLVKGQDVSIISGSNMALVATGVVTTS